MIIINHQDFKLTCWYNRWKEMLNCIHNDFNKFQYTLQKISRHAFSHIIIREPFNILHNDITATIYYNMCTVRWFYFSAVNINDSLAERGDLTKQSVMYVWVLWRFTYIRNFCMRLAFKCEVYGSSHFPFRII